MWGQIYFCYVPLTRFMSIVYGPEHRTSQRAAANQWKAVEIQYVKCLLADKLINRCLGLWSAAALLRRRDEGVGANERAFCIPGANAQWLRYSFHPATVLRSPTPYRPRLRENDDTPTAAKTNITS